MNTTSINPSPLPTLDYTPLEGLATPVEIDDDKWIRIRRPDVYVSLLKEDIRSIEDWDSTIRIIVKSTVVSIYTKVNNVHITIL